MRCESPGLNLGIAFQTGSLEYFRDGFLYLNGILCGRFMRYRGQGKAVSFAVYVLLGTAMADIWFYGMR